MKICHRCKQKASGPRMIRFEYRGFSFEAFKSASLCGDCVMQETIREFEEYASDIVAQGPDGIVIDWEAYAKKTMEDRTESGSPTDKMTYQLVYLGVLCHYPGKAGCWELYTDGPLILNPRALRAVLLFTRKEDAEKYRRAVLGNVEYPVYLRQIARVE